jgi:hypothetical protein
MKELNTLKTLRRRRTNFGDVLKELNVQRFAEVGVLNGENFRRLLKCQPHLAVAVDLWLADRHDEELDQAAMDVMYQGMLDLERHNPAVKVYRCSSVEGANLFPDECFDCVYIDANHSYEGCSEDIKVWWPKVRMGGIMGGHDYGNWKIKHGADKGKRFGVQQAVDEFVAKEGLFDRFVIIPSGIPNWFIVKP